MAKKNTSLLLIAQMKRAIEILENDEELNLFVTEEGYRGNEYNIHNRNISELKAKLREIRRDSVRLISEIYE